jgi:hypothetical protein
MQAAPKPDGCSAKVRHVGGAATGHACLCSGVSEVASSSCATASMPLSGVRISWLIFACTDDKCVTHWLL